MSEIAEFHYHVPWRTGSARPGHHHSTQSGGGYEFHGHVPLSRQPDPRHLDVRASLLDPFGQYQVRTFRQRSTVPVQVIADLSASLSAAVGSGKTTLIARFVASAAYSAYRTGDPFSFIAAADEILWDLHLPLRWHRSLDPRLLQQLAGFRAEQSARALQTIAPHLGRERSLVFLLSDFHLPLEEISAVLDSLIHHDVVPVVLWNRREYQDLPRRGLLRLRDPETGQERTLLMRASLRQKWRHAFENRRAELIHLCSGYGREPFFIHDAFQPDWLTRYFCQG